MNETTPNIPRLRKLLKAVESAPVGKFNMRHWCGTDACAAGWYAARFPEEGIVQDHTDRCLRIGPEEVTRFRLAVHFGITAFDALYLFYGGNDLLLRDEWLDSYREWLIKHALSEVLRESAEPHPRGEYRLLPEVLAARANAEHLRAAEDEGDAERRGYVDRWDDAGDVMEVAERPSRWEQE